MLFRKPVGRLSSAGVPLRLIDRGTPDVKRVDSGADTGARLWLCVYLPQLPLEVYVRAQPDPGTLAIHDGHARTPCVIAATAMARAAGVQAGMHLEAAYALCAGLRVLARDAVAEQRLLHNFAAWCGRFSPLITLVPPDTVLVEVRGSLRLFGGIEPLWQAVQKGVRGLGFTAQLALAPSPLAATWLARAGVVAKVFGQGGLVRQLSQLPLDVLRLDGRDHASLRGMGLRRLGDVLRLPRAGLARRLGPQLLNSLDQALGRIPDPRPSFVAPPRFVSELLLPDDVDVMERLLFGVQRLVQELADWLEARVVGVTVLQVLLQHRRGRGSVVRVSCVEPTRDARHIFALLAARLERLRLPAPVQALRLMVLDSRPLAGRSTDLFEGAHAPRQRLDQAHAVLLEQLRARLGDKAVRGLCMRDDHRPECAWRWCEPGMVDAVPEQVPMQRPLWLLQEPVSLRMRDGRPWLVGELRLLSARERIEGGWWDGADVARDYFIAEDRHGARYWIFRELHTNEGWFLQGIFA